MYINSWSGLNCGKGWEGWLTANERMVSLLEKNVLKLDCGNDCTIMWTYQKYWMYTLNQWYGWYVSCLYKATKLLKIN